MRTRLPWEGVLFQQSRSSVTHGPTRRPSSWKVSASAAVCVVILSMVDSLFGHAGKKQPRCQSWSERESPAQLATDQGVVKQAKERIVGEGYQVPKGEVPARRHLPTIRRYSGRT